MNQPIKPHFWSCPKSGTKFVPGLGAFSPQLRQGELCTCAAAASAPSTCGLNPVMVDGVGVRDDFFRSVAIRRPPYSHVSLRKYVYPDTPVRQQPGVSG